MPAGNAEIDAAVADAFGLSKEQRSLLHGDGPQSELAYRVAWARTSLRQAGALENAGKALWNLTSAGRKMSCAEVERAYNEYLRSRRTSDKGGRSARSTSSKDDYSPVEDWRQSVCAALQAMPLHAFARLVDKLLESAGFDELHVTGNSADGEIGAVGVYRPFGLIAIRTNIQCQRWRGAVGRERIEAFQQASRHKSDRGIIMTTGAFSAEARAQAQVVFPVDLIDGMQLAELLKERELGVRVTLRTVEDVTIDESYLA